MRGISFHIISVSLVALRLDAGWGSSWIRGDEQPGSNDRRSFEVKWRGE